MESNLIMDITASFTPLKPVEFKTKIIFKVERLYDEQKDILGIYNPGSLISELKLEKHPVGKGSDGALKVEPSVLELGQLKLVFIKNYFFLFIIQL